jgi:hypothetical protein
MATRHDPGPLERFLVQGTPPDAATLTRSRLEPYAYAQAPRDDASRAAHRAAFMTATARHLATKAVILPLVRAWRDAGIEVIVFKGFYLAELVYDQPAQRYYNDVDIVMRQRRWPEAERIARRLGWMVLWNRRDSLYRSNHEEAVIERDGTTVEVHRLVIDCASPFDALQRRYTEAAWRASSEVSWEDTAIRVLSPADSALLGLVLARAWSGGDDWHLKPADYLDLRMLAERAGLEREALDRRAQELGCDRTLRLVLDRCDPWRGRLRLRAPTRRERRAWQWAVVGERGHLGLERALASLARLPGTFVDVVAHAPRLLVARRRLRAGAPAGAGGAPVQAAPSPSRAASLRTKERVVRGVKWGARLLSFGKDPCRLRSYALFDALASLGMSVRLVEARADRGDGDRRHAWIELDGVSLRDLEDVRTCAVDEIVACYPSQRSQGAVAAAPGPIPRSEAT